VQAISEAFLLPVIEHMIDQFPFHIQGCEVLNHSCQPIDPVIDDLNRTVQVHTVIGKDF